MQNTIDPCNKAIIFVPKRTCLFQGAMDSGSAGKGLRKGGQKKRRVETQYS